MRRVLYAISILLLVAACSRDTAETRNPGGDPPAPLAGSGATSPDNTDTTALGTTTTAGTDVTTTGVTATGGITTTDTTAASTDTRMPQP